MDQAVLDRLADAASDLTGDRFDLVERLVCVGKALVKLLAILANAFFDQGFTLRRGGQGRLLKGKDTA